MIKRSTLLFLLLFISVGLSAQAKVGMPVAEVKLDVILNAPVRQTQLSDLRGKVVLLEFWATWCSPCVEAMPHFQELQKKFKGKLQVITVSTEKEKRIRQFLDNRPSDLWFAVDTADLLRKQFPYHTIPHSVLIDQKGTVVAITEPRNITIQIITDVNDGKKISLPVKEDNMTQDPWITYFPADTAEKSHFLVQPGLPGLGSASRRYNLDPVFKYRRISMMNLSLGAVYRIAYGNFSYGRTIDLTPRENVTENKKMYCIDILVPKGQEKQLLPTLRKELNAQFDLKAGIEKRVKPVYVLSIADSSKIAFLKKSGTVEESLSASSGTFSGEGVHLKQIADYLEGFGLVSLPVVDETGNTVRYDIKFSYLPEKKGDLEDALLKLGLKLTKAERGIDMLVFR